MTMESIIYMEKVRSSQASVSINSYIELSETVFPCEYCQNYLFFSPKSKAKWHM